MSVLIKSAFAGRKIVWGVPAETKPILGLPEGKVRIRLRNDSVGRAFVRSQSEARHFILLDCGEHWEVVVQGANKKL